MIAVTVCQFSDHVNKFVIFLIELFPTERILNQRKKSAASLLSRKFTQINFLEKLRKIRIFDSRSESFEKVRICFREFDCHFASINFTESNFSESDTFSFGVIVLEVAKSYDLKLAYAFCLLIK